MAKVFAADKYAKVFGLLSDETRLRIVQTLSVEKSMNVTGLCELLQKPQPTISHHLGLLRMSGLVKDDRDGKQVVYSISDDMPSLTIDGVKLK